MLLAAVMAGGTGPRAGAVTEPAVGADGFCAVAVPMMGSRISEARRTKPMDFNEIPSFPIHCTEVTVRVGEKFLSEQEFVVVLFAATGISARSRRIARARLTFAVEWSNKGKKTILHQDCCNPKLR